MLTLQLDSKINNNKRTRKPFNVRLHFDKADDAETFTAFEFKDGVNCLKP